MVIKLHKYYCKYFRYWFTREVEARVCTMTLEFAPIECKVLLASGSPGPFTFPVVGQTQQPFLVSCWRFLFEVRSVISIGIWQLKLFRLKLDSEIYMLGEYWGEPAFDFDRARLRFYSGQATSYMNVNLEGTLCDFFTHYCSWRLKYLVSTPISTTLSPLTTFATTLSSALTSSIRGIWAPLSPAPRSSICYTARHYVR